MRNEGKCGFIRHHPANKGCYGNPRARALLIIAYKACVCNQAFVNVQAKVVNDLRELGAKPSTVAEEEKRLHDLEAALSSNFRKVVRSRLRRSSVRGNAQASVLTFIQALTDMKTMPALIR